MRFDRVMGFSIGAVNGTALAFGRLSEGLRRWRALDGGVLRFSPRLDPFGLFSTAPLREFFAEAADEARARAELKCDLTVMTSCAAEGRSINARFAPGGAEWDSPLVEHAAASCAIPTIFPPVDLVYRGRALRLVDGGVPMPRPVDFSPLAGCADVLVVEMVRADELGRRPWLPWRALDQGAREAARGIVDEGLQGLLTGDKPPRVFRLAPSKRLSPIMLDFRKAGIERMLAQGAADAKALLADPAAYRAS